MKLRPLVMRLVTAAAAATVALPALAHTGAGAAHGFGHGFAHPLGGPDHLLAMLAVGIFAAQLGGTALWLVPAAFVAAMAGGFGLAYAGLGLPLVEVAIASSVIVFGVAIASRPQMPVVGAMALVGAFAIFHGHAHGSEMPADASGFAYAAGFVLATALLHLAGITVGVAAGRLGRLGVPRVAGGGIAIAGLMILAGSL